MLTATAPVSRRSLKDNLTLSAFWFGIEAHWALLLPILMPADVQRLVGEQNKAIYLGLLIGWLALIPLVVPPLVGAISDRVGRRMAFIMSGTLVNVAGLAVMYAAPSFALYFVGFLIVQVGNNLATSPYNALIPDLVPAAERGAASGIMGLLTLVGQIVGFGAAFAFSGNRLVEYIIIGVLLIGSGLVTVISTPEPKRHAKTAERPDWGAFLRPEYRDFRWVFLTRLFNEFGRAAVQPFLLYYLIDVIVSFKVGGLTFSDSGMALALLLGLLTVFGAVTAVWGGNISDRVGKKPIIYVAGAFMAAGAMGFALVHSFTLALVMGLIFGLGYGAYMSVDWALGTAVLPNPRALARDMGVWHVAMVFPQVFDSAGGRLLTWGNTVGHNSGYTILFAVAVVFFLMGTVFISQVRSVK